MTKKARFYRTVGANGNGKTDGASLLAINVMGCRRSAEAASPAAVPKNELALLYVYTYIVVMRTTTYSELRKNLARMLDSVGENRDAVIVTREGGKPAAVLMSLEEFASYEETLHLLKSPANAKRLREAIAELESGRGRARKLAV
jgi:antitoxin YefM